MMLRFDVSAKPWESFGWSAFRLHFDSANLISFRTSFLPTLSTYFSHSSFPPSSSRKPREDSSDACRVQSLLRFSHSTRFVSVSPSPLSWTTFLPLITLVDLMNSFRQSAAFRLLPNLLYSNSCFLLSCPHTRGYASFLSYTTSRISFSLAPSESPTRWSGIAQGRRIEDSQILYLVAPAS